MPEASSMIRTVPGGNSGPAGGSCADDDGASATGSESGRPRNTAATTTATSTSSETPTTQAVRAPPVPLDGSSAGGTGDGGRDGGARTGEDWTATPGPDGMATSDQVRPFYQRTSPGVPSGSGYQPGAGCSGPVTASTLGRRVAFAPHPRRRRDRCCRRPAARGWVRVRRGR